AQHLRIAQHLPPDEASRKERRSPDQPFLAVEEDLKRAGEPADEAVLALPTVLLEEAPEDDLAPERQLRLLDVPEVVEEALGLTGGVLHAVEQRRETRLFPAEPLAPEDRHRHQEHRLLHDLARAQEFVQVVRAEPGRGKLAAPSPGHGLAPHED